MKTLTRLFTIASFALASSASAQTAADTAGIRAAALDYMEGWYAGDGARMERAVHPELAKRIMRVSPDGMQSRLESMGAMTLVQYTKSGGGRNTPPAMQQKDLQIFDIYGNAASARGTMSGWIDYMQLAKSNGRWTIVNVLWEMKPNPTTKP